MIFRQFSVPGLGQYSYGIGCDREGTAAIVDPERDADVYLEWAKQEGVRIAFVLETHVHADFASGAAELAERAGVPLCRSAYDRGEAHRPAGPRRDLLEGDEIAVGSLILRPLHTPGHTPEHLSFVLVDRGRSESPLALFSGDLLFAGSVGRPDLFGPERADRLARDLFRSLRERIGDLPDGVLVHPAHGPGSSCGTGALGGAITTLGYERAANPLLAPDLGEDEFVKRVLAGMTPPQHYFRIQRFNCEGPPAVPADRGRREIDLAEFSALRDAGATVVDVRGPAAFGAGHVPGSICLGPGPRRTMWAPWVVPADRPVLFVADGPEAGRAAALDLARVAVEDVRGRLAGGLEAWAAAGGAVGTLAQLSPREAYAQSREGAIRIVDVRGEAEWRAGHAAGSRPMDGASFVAPVPDRPDQTVGLICRTGYAANVVASELLRRGVRGIANVAGGLMAWKAAGLPVER